MVTVKVACLVGILIVSMAGCSLGQNRACKQPKENGVLTVRAQDIPAKVRITGLLGQPLGSLITVSGKWVQRIEKEDIWFFDFAAVNGKELREPVEMASCRISPAWCPPYLAGGLMHGELWDWRIGIIDGTMPSPRPAKGERWEMLGVETGDCNQLRWYSQEVLREIFAYGGMPIQMGDTGAFYTCFEYIAVRKMK